MDVSHHHQVKNICICGRHGYGWGGLGGGGALAGMKHVAQNQRWHISWHLAPPQEGREIWLELVLRPGKGQSSDWPPGGVHPNIRTPTGRHKSDGVVLCQTVFHCWDSPSQEFA